MHEGTVAHETEKYGKFSKLGRAENAGRQGRASPSMCVSVSTKKRRVGGGQRI
jgi:hypothetical protein